MWPFDRKKIARTVLDAKLAQIRYENENPEPYDQDQRFYAVLIRAKYLLRSRGLRIPTNLPGTVHRVLK